jgi:flagellin FlaB
MFDNENDDRGQVGIGTLIVFIAMVLVAAIAAGVLVNTAGFLQSTAQDTGTESVDKVTNRLDVVSAHGIVDSNSQVEHLNVTLALAAGSSGLNFNNTTIKYISDTNVTTLDNETTGVTLNKIKDDGDPSYPVFEDTGDRYEVQLQLGVIPKTGPLSPGNSVTLEVTTRSGATTTYRLSIPASMAGKGDGDPVIL